VVPAVAGLKRQGASKGAVLSFLIATPETGADSIPLTYALMDPLMAIIRPVAAFITAVTAGIAQNLLGNGAADPDAPLPGIVLNAVPIRPPLIARIRMGVRYAFSDLLVEIAPSFIAGLLLAGAIMVWIPETFVEAYLGNPWTAMGAMLVIGLPLYVCATSSTPIAAAFILKGINPGAALVFLLVGPATNAASLTMVSGMLGRRSVSIYLMAVIGCSLALGLMTDQIYGVLGMSPVASAGQAREFIPDAAKTVAAFGLLALMAPALKRLRFPKPAKKTS